MPDRPDEMLQGDRPADNIFNDPNERLYRRVPSDYWLEPPYEMEVDAIDAVNISVNRGKYSKPSWVRFDRDEYADWPVLFWLVGDLPSERHYAGQLVYRILLQHVPLRKNYPHSEIRLFCNGARIMKEDELDPQFSLLWREHLLLIAKIALRPFQESHAELD